MTILDIIVIAVGVSMDAFAVSITKGLAKKSLRLKHYISVALWFGGFQALMPLVGYMLGANFAAAVASFDHWIAFVLLTVIGGHMLYESLCSDGDDEPIVASFGAKIMLMMAVATSIDALAVGVTFAFLRVNIWWAIAFIGVTTFCFSGVGIKIGSIFGSKFKSKAEMAGGLILIILGAKILIEHTLFA
jgi:putative Mn2+ efflux pump MntP